MVRSRVRSFRSYRTVRSYGSFKRIGTFEECGGFRSYRSSFRRWRRGLRRRSGSGVDPPEPGPEVPDGNRSQGGGGGCGGGLVPGAGNKSGPGPEKGGSGGGEGRTGGGECRTGSSLVPGVRIYLYLGTVQGTILDTLSRVE